MLIAIILVLMLFEVGAFFLSAVLHAGVPVFGLEETHGSVETTTQAVIGLVIAVSVLGIWRRQAWVRPTVLTIHVFAVAGAILGMVATRGQSQYNALNAYNPARLAAMLAVLVLLSLPRTRAALGVRRAARWPLPRS